MKRKTWMRALAITVAGVALPALSSAAPIAAQPALLLAQATPAAAPMVDGEVRKVDKSTGKITLRHGPIPNLDMPNMTMVFRVKDPAMLDLVKSGDKVRFAADRVGGQFTVVMIEVKK